jgi:hypothetical protein
VQSTIPRWCGLQCSLHGSLQCLLIVLQSWSLQCVVTTHCVVCILSPRRERQGTLWEGAIGCQPTLGHKIVRNREIDKQTLLFAKFVSSFIQCNI